MSNISRRIDRVERKMNPIENDDVGKARLLEEMKRIEGHNPLKASLLRLEVKYGHSFTLVDAYASR